MRCLRCKRNVLNKKTRFGLCISCQKQVIEKKIRKKIRNCNRIFKNSKILVVDKCTMSLLKKILRLDYELFYKPLREFGIRYIDQDIFFNKKIVNYIKKHKMDCLVLPWTADHTILSFIKKIGFKKENFKKIQYRKQISEFVLLLYEDFDINEMNLFFKRFSPYLSSNEIKIIELFNNHFKIYADIKKSFLKGIVAYSKICQ